MDLASKLLTLSIAMSLPFASAGAGLSLGPSSLSRTLSAVRGEIVRISKAGKGSLLITVRPSKDFPEVTVLARENDLVGSAVGRVESSDLLGLLSEDQRDNETITAAELNEGDIISVIYDPASQNRALEIYVR
jgi:hypothetical protein